jgi:diphosphomevalonate decarboxylase
MKARAVAHSNIALVKYWGKRDVSLNLPAAGSLSVTLDGLSTTTTVTFEISLDDDQLILDGHEVTEGRALARVANFLDLIRREADLSLCARVESANDFPTAAGLASSASGFAALALAATTAAGLDWPKERLSALARRGSGSAARSLFGGFAEMKPGLRPDGADAHAIPVAGPDHWDLRCLVALTARGEKKVGSTEGMQRTQATSPFFHPWLATMDDDLAAARQAIEDRNFGSLAAVAERSCLRMHATAIGADPGILYWNATTTALIHAVRDARDSGLPCFFSIDAGPHVKVFCPASSANEVETMLRETEGVLDVLLTKPGRGARLVEVR